MITYPTSTPSLRIRDMGIDDQPREKMLAHGPRALSDAEIVAIILGSGLRGASALEVSRQLLRSVHHDLHELARREVQDLRRFPGVGKVKALRLVAALELGRRREVAVAHTKPLLATSEQAFRYLRPLIGDLAHEEFHLLCLNRAGYLLGAHLISRGGVTSTVVDGKSIFRAALSHASTCSLVLAHNHPSGVPLPSTQDVALTHKLTTAARHLDLQVLDHLIVAGHRYYSFAEEEILDAADAPH